MKILLAILSLLYAVSPYDLIPDLLPGWGWIDDLIVLGLAWWYFSNFKKARLRYGDFYARGNRRNFYSRTEGTGGKASSSRQETGGGGAKPRQEETAKDPYRVLGVRRGADKEEIKRAYRELAGKYHPDKVNHLGEEFKELAARRFREIENAYRELTGR